METRTQTRMETRAETRIATSGRDYEYRGLLAATWDLFRGDTSRWADRLRYRDLIRESGEPALDVGCATGRLLLDYLADGVEIDGVDNSPEILELCREKAARAGLAPRLYLQEMADLDLPRRYRTILVPSSSIQLLTDPAEAARAMGRFFAHLLPGGLLAMSCMRLNGPPGPEQAEWQLAERAWPEAGAVARRWSREWFDAAAGLEHTEARYEVVRDGEVLHAERHLRSPATRSYTREQAAALYREAGLEDVRAWKGFTREPAGPEEALFLVTGRRPAGPEAG